MVLDGLLLLGREADAVACHFLAFTYHAETTDNPFYSAVWFVALLSCSHNCITSIAILALGQPPIAVVLEAPIVFPSGWQAV